MVELAVRIGVEVREGKGRERDQSRNDEGGEGRVSSNVCRGRSSKRKKEPTGCSLVKTRGSFFVSS